MITPFYYSLLSPPLVLEIGRGGGGKGAEVLLSINLKSDIVSSSMLSDYERIVKMDGVLKDFLQTTSSRWV